MIKNLQPFSAMPFTIFSHQDNTENVRNLLIERGANVNGTEADWQAEFVLKKGLLRKTKITFTYDREWCSPPNWPVQIEGMQNFVGGFEMTEEVRQKMMSLIRVLKCSIGIMTDPEIASGDDSRLDLMHDVARLMDAIFFVPDAILDAEFLPLAAADGNFSTQAKFPDFPQGVPVAAEIKIDRNEPVEEIELNPPNADRVAKRALALVAVAARGLIDMNLSQGLTPAYTHESLIEWTEGLSLHDEFEPAEVAIIKTAPEQLNKQDVMNSIWRLEGLAVLAWALGVHELPAYDCVVDTDTLFSKLGFRQDDSVAHELLSNPVLASANKLETYNNQIFSYHWRMTDFRVRPMEIDFKKMETECWFGPLDLSWATFANNDLVLSGQPIAEADSNLIGLAGSIAMERHIASNWLIGHSVVYSETDAST